MDKESYKFRAEWFNSLVRMSQRVSLFRSFGARYDALATFCELAYEHDRAKSLRYLSPKIIEEAKKMGEVQGIVLSRHIEKEDPKKLDYYDQLEFMAVQVYNTIYGFDEIEQ